MCTCIEYCTMSRMLNHSKVLIRPTEIRHLSTLAHRPSKVQTSTDINSTSKWKHRSIILDSSCGLWKHQRAERHEARRQMDKDDDME